MHLRSNHEKHGRFVIGVKVLCFAQICTKPLVGECVLWNWTLQTKHGADDSERIGEYSCEMIKTKRNVW